MPVEQAAGGERHECEAQRRNHDQLSEAVAEAKHTDQARTRTYEHEPQGEDRPPEATRSCGHHNQQGIPRDEDDCWPQQSTVHRSPRQA